MYISAQPTWAYKTLAILIAVVKYLSDNEYHFFHKSSHYKQRNYVPGLTFRIYHKKVSLHKTHNQFCYNHLRHITCIIPKIKH